MKKSKVLKSFLIILLIFTFCFSFTLFSCKATAKEKAKEELKEEIVKEELKEEIVKELADILGEAIKKAGDEETIVVEEVEEEAIEKAGDEETIVVEEVEEEAIEKGFIEYGPSDIIPDAGESNIEFIVLKGITVVVTGGPGEVAGYYFPGMSKGELRGSVWIFKGGEENVKVIIEKVATGNWYQQYVCTDLPALLEYTIWKMQDSQFKNCLGNGCSIVDFFVGQCDPNVPGGLVVEEVGTR